MKTSRLRWSILLSITFHLLLLGLLRFLPAAAIPEPSAPVVVRVLHTPVVSSAGERPKTANQPPYIRRRGPDKATPKPPARRSHKGGVLADLAKPVRQERPQEAKLVSRFDSKAQDIGPGPAAARKASGANPRDLPPELALPERYSQLQPTSPVQASRSSVPREPVASPLPPVPLVPREPRPAPRAGPKTQPQAESRTDTRPVPRPERSVSAPALTSPERRFRITAAQEIAMLQRQPSEAEADWKQTSQERATRLQQRLPFASFDAPGIYDRGPQQPGEGQGKVGGGKYRSIGAYGLKHFSYLIGIKRKIDLVFSVPFFAPQGGPIGVPIVGFTIQRGGQLAESVLLRSSGHVVLDRALLKAVRQAAPYPPFPEDLSDTEISIRVYVTFS